MPNDLYHRVSTLVKLSNWSAAKKTRSSGFQKSANPNPPASPPSPAAPSTPAAPPKPPEPVPGPYYPRPGMVPPRSFKPMPAGLGAIAPGPIPAAYAARPDVDTFENAWNFRKHLPMLFSPRMADRMTREGIHGPSQLKAPDYFAYMALANYLNQLKGEFPQSHVPFYGDPLLAGSGHIPWYMSRRLQNQADIIEEVLNDMQRGVGVFSPGVRRTEPAYLNRQRLPYASDLELNALRADPELERLALQRLLEAYRRYADYYRALEKQGPTEPPGK